VSETATKTAGAITHAGVPEGFDALILARLAREGGRVHLHVARDEARMAALAETLAFFAPDIPVLQFPAWDCLPYDRVSPRTEILAQRMAVLSAMAHRKGEGVLIVLTTVNAALQRVPARGTVATNAFAAHVGNDLDLEALTAFLDHNGYSRASTVREPGDFAIRGGIVDLFAPGADEPLRLDLFGDTLDSVRTFDPETQRTTGQRDQITLVPANEIILDAEAIQRFRRAYVTAFGATTGDDPLYEAISAGRMYQGMEHWLPLFHENLETLFDYVPGAGISLDYLADEAREERLTLIDDYYAARAEIDESKATALAAPKYKPLSPSALYLQAADWDAALAQGLTRHLSPFKPPEAARVVDEGAKRARDFAPERKREGVNVFEAVVDHITALQKGGARVIIACWSEGSRDRMRSVLSDHGLLRLADVSRFSDVQTLPEQTAGFAILPLEHGFESAELAILSEQDILGDRLVRQRHKTRRAHNFLTEATSLSQGDLVVHVDHGIGRYEGLRTLEVTGAPHDCLEIQYHGGDKLYLPVENIELLSRYGSEEAGAQLDRLGGSNWQARKAKLKERIRDMAERLIKIAAERELKDADVVHPDTGPFEEFCARFPYQETEDQLDAINDVLSDLERGRPMDRLVCGDVGFGKTEVALRAAFVVAMTGRQVAIVVPTTLLARQHFASFKERFAGWPVKVRQLSRMIGTKEAAQTREDLARGEVDIVIGTHALLSKKIKMKDLGLLVIDEEQHFGVRHKERLKELKAQVHVLTLTATPIPRTLQLAMSGIRELSIIATPPVDRLAVRTFVSPFDPVVIREALLRERFRGGQCFYVCPRISDLREVAEFLDEMVPEVKYAVAHGQMPPTELEDIMTAFYDRQYDVLLSTTIIESGLDIPTANTLVVHRADMFGLAQLYQIRGRIGRSKVRAYAYLTVPPRQKITDNATKRLEVLQSLDTLGAGFTLASHDLDIRGAGNLLGEEQSGQVREVGIELYQQLLEEAVANARAGAGEAEAEGDAEEAWSPQINLGTSVLIPERYVPDLHVRMGLYRRAASLVDRAEVDAFAAELIDRFGALPQEVENLLQILSIKQLCRDAGVEKLDAGPKGAVVAFRGDSFANPAGLVGFIQSQPGKVKLRPDHKLVYQRQWESASERATGVRHLLERLAGIAARTAA
jgi:transcription-repair coupling factor (superfamily II helicase)